jgi:tagatose-6-phosphate ketose/aldose isomerase
LISFCFDLADDNITGSEAEPVGQQEKISRNTIEEASRTWVEIAQQSTVWPTTLDRIAHAVEDLNLGPVLSTARVLLTGAGTSAYASSAIAAAWRQAIAVPSTDLLINVERYIRDVDVVISVARSGDSPESLATVDRIHKLRPEVMQLAITCDPKGALARSPLVRPILLDPRTNDESLVMTGSFSNLTLAGLSLADATAVAAALPTACSNAQLHFETVNDVAIRIAKLVEERLVLLSSSPLYPWAQEGALKSLEMTAGRFSVMAETYLGLRHGPLSFVNASTIVLCLLSNDSIRRQYEFDLIKELRMKNLGILVGIGASPNEASLFDENIPAILPIGPDVLRVPFEIIAPQLLGYHLSLRAGLNPDNPSPDGVINRVVKGVQIY